MQFSSLLFPVTLLAMAGFSAAENCKQGLKYCDESLLFRGNYERTIQNAMRHAGVTPDDRPNVLFNCLDKGAIDVYIVCPHACRQIPSDSPDWDWGDDHC